MSSLTALVVLVVDEPDDCCWRSGMHAAFTDAGAAVTVMSRHDVTRRGARTSLARAQAVVAASPAAAKAALERGAPARLLWVRIPALDERHPHGAPPPLEPIDEDAATLGFGIVADTHESREAIERVMSHLRPRIEILPPRTWGTPCHTCGMAAEDAPEGESTGFVPTPRTPWGEVETPTPLSTSRYPRALPTDADRVRAAERILAPRMVERHRPRRSVLVSGFDLKFVDELAHELSSRDDFDVSVDAWPDLAKPSRQTGRLARRADAILAEWARPSAAWLSHRKRARQMLVVRLHRYELESRYPRDIAIDNVDAVVYIAPLFGQRIQDDLGWPADKLVYIPNYIDTASFWRSKLPGAQFTLGFVGIEVARKRFDLALDLVAALRREDPRFTLRVRSRMPWQNRYVWDKPEERAYARMCLQRIEDDPLLRNGVVFDPPGRDMARWFRGIGHILSTSEAEGSHTSLAEGMASGAVPIVRPWAGADLLYGKEWLAASMGEAVTSIIECVHADVWQQRSDQARSEVNISHNPASVVAAWADLLHGRLDSARRHFADTALLASQSELP